ncbi:hypothetical protein MTO96_049657 [Rhipicephalus appendiculatus]
MPEITRSGPDPVHLQCVGRWANGKASNIYIHGRVNRWPRRVTRVHDQLRRPAAPDTRAGTSSPASQPTAAPPLLLRERAPRWRDPYLGRIRLMAAIKPAALSGEGVRTAVRPLFPPTPAGLFFALAVVHLYTCFEQLDKDPGRNSASSFSRQPLLVHFLSVSSRTVTPFSSVSARAACFDATLTSDLRPRQ